MADKDLTYTLKIADGTGGILQKKAAEAAALGENLTAAQAKEVANQLREQSRLVEEQVTNSRKVEKAAKEAADAQSKSLKSAQSELKTANSQALADEKVAAKLREAAEKVVGEEVKKTAMAQSQAASDVAKNSRAIATISADRVNVEKKITEVTQGELSGVKKVREAHQEKYNALKMEEARAREATSTIIAGDKAVKEAKKDAAKASKEAAQGTKKHAEEASSLHRTMERIQRTVAAFVAVWAFQKITSGISAIVKGGLEFNAIMEESKLGMSAIFMAQGQFVTASGRAQEGTEALNSAMEMSTKISKELQLDNLKTAATYQQLVKAYQQTIAPGLAVGFDPEQIREYTVAMVQAASALGLNLDMLAEETRSMLRGAITPRNTLIATALGIRNEDINRYKGDVDGLYKYVMGRLSAFGVAGEAVQMTWKGVMSNVKDVIQMALGEGFTNLFEYLKKQALEVQKSLVKWDVGGPKLDQEVVAVFASMGQAVIEIIEGTKTWLASLSGLLPIFGLIYQILRTIFLVLTPIVQGLGVILSVVGFIAEELAKALKEFNDLVISSKAAYSIFIATAAVVGMYAASFMNAVKFGTMLVAVLKLSAANAAYVATFLASWGPPLLAAIAILGLLSTVFPIINDALKESWYLLGKLVGQSELYRVAVIGITAVWMASLGPMGKIIAGLMLMYELTNTIKKSAPMRWMDKASEKFVDLITGTTRTLEQTTKLNTQMADMGMGRSDVKTTEELAKQVTFKARIIKLDDAQEDELRKIASITGELTEYDRRRMTLLNDITGSYQDSYKELYKQIDLINSGKFEIPKLEGIDTKFIGEFLSVGLTNEFYKIQTSLDATKDRSDALKESLSKMVSIIPKFEIDMADLTRQEQEIIAKVARQYEKSTLTPELKIKIAAEAQIEIDKSRVGIQLEVSNIDAQIAAQNKQYSIQRALVDEILKTKLRQKELEIKENPALAAAMRRDAEQQNRQTDIQQQQERLGWESRLATSRVYWAEMHGNIEKQVNAETAVFELKQTTEMNAAQFRTAEDQAAIRKIQAAEKVVFLDQGARKIALDKLNYESKINDLKFSAAQMTGNYKLEADLLKEQYVISMSIMAVQAGITGERLEELSILHGLIAGYKKQELLINGEYNAKKQILDLENTIAGINGETAQTLSIQFNLLKLQVGQMEELLALKIKLAKDTGGMDPKVLKDMKKAIALTKVSGVSAINKKDLELWHTQNQEALQYQSTIAELSGDWNKSKLIGEELLKLELDRVLVLGNLSNDAKIYATEAARLKIAESEAYRLLNQYALEDIGMKKYAIKLSQDLADQYANKIPNAIDLSVNAFGTFLESIGSGTKSIGDSFRALFFDIGKGILKLLIDIQMAQLKLAIMRSLGYGEASPIVAIGAAILSPTSSAAGGGFTLGGQAGGNYLLTGNTTFPGLASGGPVSAGNAYWVGERGPEPFIPNTSGTIIPNSKIGGLQNIKIELINQSGGPNLQSKSAEVKINPDEYIISVVMDAANRNRMGFRDMLGGG